ncbi:MAG: lysylphosphatidylglycerol synthase transmembrane domain-containing protein [Candidatus Marinimicrobia bacterium]|nr:lysylphosphatidylglycerol synthase transmembrane domain-containing protein [Candidatus Neomarinimicrobiota bacterium]
MNRRPALYYVKSIVVLVLKLAISVLLVRIAIRKVDLSELGQIYGTIDVFEAAAIALFILANWSLQIVRWGRILRSNGVPASFIETLKSYFIGYTFRLLIPGGYAEFLKIYYLNGKRRLGFIAYGVEMITMAVTQVLTMAVAGFFIFPKQWFFFVILAICAIATCVFLPYLRKIKFIGKFIPDQTLQYSLILQSGLLTLASLVAINWQYHFILNWSGTISWLSCAAAVIFILCSGSVPFTFAGLGVRENLSIYLFGLFGVKSSVAVATSLFIFSTNFVLPALIGLVFILLHQVKRRSLPVPVHSIPPEA